MIHFQLACVMHRALQDFFIMVSLTGPFACALLKMYMTNDSLMLGTLLTEGEKPPPTLEIALELLAVLAE